MEIKFKIAQETDIENIVKLCNECFNEYTKVEEAKKQFLENQDKNGIYLIGECNGEIIAHTRIAIIPTIFEGMDTFAILNHICVRPDFRKHKIATEMLKVVKKICIQRNCRSIKLWSKNFRVPAHSCYKNFGFSPIEATFFELEM